MSHFLKVTPLIRAIEGQNNESKTNKGPISEGGGVRKVSARGPNLLPFSKWLFSSTPPKLFQNQIWYVHQDQLILSNVHRCWVAMALGAGFLSWVLACHTIEKKRKSSLLPPPFYYVPYNWRRKNNRLACSNRTFPRGCWEWKTSAPAEMSRERKYSCGNVRYKFKCVLENNFIFSSTVLENKAYPY